MTDASADRPTTVADYLAILRRRKWIVIVPVLVAGLSAFFVSSRQEPEYRATAQVLVDSTNLAGAFGPTSPDPVRFLNTLAGISRSPVLAGRVAAELPGMTAGTVLRQTEVTPSADSDLLSVAATDSREAMTVRLANTFASEFTKFTEERAQHKIESGLASIRRPSRRFAPRAKRILPSTQTCLCRKPSSRRWAGSLAGTQRCCGLPTERSRRSHDRGGTDPRGSLRPRARSGAGVPRGGTRPPCSIRTRGGRGSRGGRSSRGCRSRRGGFARPMRLVMLAIPPASRPRRSESSGRASSS